VYLSETSQKGDFDTLPPLPNLQRLCIAFDGSFLSNHHGKLADLSLLENLQKLEVRGKASSIWSHIIVESSNSIKRLFIENVKFVDTDWSLFYPRLSCLRSLTMNNVSLNSIGLVTLNFLECLQLKDCQMPGVGYPELTCPRLKLFVYTVRHPRAPISPIVEHMLSQYTASLESFMLSSGADNRAETLTPLATQKLSHCKLLRNFLFEGRISITAQDWWVLHKVHDDLDRALFIQPANPKSEAERTFHVRSPPEVCHNVY
jgi:hypothetical protein